MKRTVLAVCLCALAQSATWAKVDLPDIFSDNMVLQQQTDARLWGWSEPGAKVTVGTSWSGNAPVMHIGSLRVADTYAGLFVTGDTPEDTPAITLSESNLDFGGTYAGYVMTKTVNVKAKNLTSDITVSRFTALPHSWSRFKTL